MLIHVDSGSRWLGQICTSSFNSFKGKYYAPPLPPTTFHIFDRLCPYHYPAMFRDCALLAKLKQALFPSLLPPTPALLPLPRGGGWRGPTAPPTKTSTNSVLLSLPSSRLKLTTTRLHGQIPPRV